MRVLPTKGHSLLTVSKRGKNGNHSDADSHSTARNTNTARPEFPTAQSPPPGPEIMFQHLQAKNLKEKQK